MTHCVSCRRRAIVVNDLCALCQRLQTQAALEEMIRSFDAMQLRIEDAKQRCLDLQYQLLLDQAPFDE
jgi:hypothetical protein